MNSSQNHNYAPAFFVKEDTMVSDWVLILIQKSILLKKIGNIFGIPEKNDLAELWQKEEDLIYIGTYEGHGCYCIRLSELIQQPRDMELVDFMKISDLSGDPGLFILTGAANHILHWIDANQFCGRCGHKMGNKKDERARSCPNCKNVVYPRISPATITAVFCGDQILLAHNRNFRPDLYSLIAGYVEPGETLEQCVAREIGEEVGIKVKNIKYFSSQPWSFPDSLMMAFTAEYDSGDVVVDNSEITDAAWFSADNLPVIPSTDSIAGRMIRWYRDQYQKI